MMSELAEINAKIARARANFEDIRNFFPGRAEAVVTKDVTYHSHPDGLTHDFFVKVQPPPIEFRLGIGDIIHDARTCLDHLIYRILARRGGLPVATNSRRLRKVQFLICDDPHKFKAAQGSFRDLVGADVIAAMEALQKHHGTDDVRRLHLWQLSELDNITKHRAIPVVYQRLVHAEVTVTVLGEVIRRFPLHNPEGKPLDDGTKLFTLAFDNAPPEMHVNVNQANAIVFTDTGVCDGDGVWAVLKRLIDSTQSIIDDFAEKFLI